MADVAGRGCPGPHSAGHCQRLALCILIPCVPQTSGSRGEDNIASTLAALCHLAASAGNLESRTPGTEGQPGAHHSVQEGTGGMKAEPGSREVQGQNFRLTPQ